MSRTIGQLEKLFRMVNSDLFNGQLEPVTITVQSTPRAYGHIILGDAWENDLCDLMMNRNEYGGIRVGGGDKAANGGVIPTGTHKPSSTRKLICPCCGQSVRATKAVNIICGDCLVRMEEV